MRDALTVGINTYYQLPKLRAPARDAEAVACLLEEHSDFRVQRLPEVLRGDRAAVARKTPVTVQALESALVRLFKPSGAHVPHTALFYFSGHGIQRHVGVREGYLALSDTDLAAGNPGLSLSWLRRLLQESPVRQQIVILDCCHSGELLTFLDADPGARPGVDRMFMVACRDYEAAYEAVSGGHSLLTQAILEGLDPRTYSTGRITNYALASRVSQALAQQPQQPLFENSGGEITLTTSGVQLPPPSRPTTCPYPGLKPFTVQETDLFFGREALTRRLIDQMIAHPLVTLVGAAGSGKTSLLQAGFMAQMRQGKGFPHSDRWRVRRVVPGRSPLKQLAAAFVDPEAAGLERAEQLRQAESFLANGGPGLVQLLRGNLLTDSSTGVGPRPRFVLVIDQFETLFTAHRGDAGPDGQQMMAAIAYALREAHDCLRVVLGLRADFVDRCLAIPELRPLMEPALLALPRLTYEQLKAAVIKPAKGAGLQYDPCLIYALLFDVVGMPDELGLLQATLQQLWPLQQQNTLTPAAYRALGGVHAILHDRADRVVRSLSPAHQAAALRIFFTLTQLIEGAEDTRRRVRKSDLFLLAESIPLVEETLEILIKERLLVASHQQLSAVSSELAPVPTQIAAGGQVIDVVHETLVRRWPLLQDWLSQHRDRLMQQRRLEEAAVEWHHLNRPKAAEYLLQGHHLLAAETFLQQEDGQDYRPGKLLRQYVATSRREAERSRREQRRLRLALPSAMAVALLVGTARCSTPWPPVFQAAGTAPLAEAQRLQGGGIAVNHSAAGVSHIAIAVEGGRVQLWQIAAQTRSATQPARLRHTLEPPSGRGNGQAAPELAFSRDGQTLTVTTLQPAGGAWIQRWSTETGILLQEQTVAAKLGSSAAEADEGTTSYGAP
ncbi:MAG: caspase family protein [Cyanobacteria bacterium P01_A01_bin.135]